MTLRVSGKHMDIGDAFRSRIEARIGDVMGKYFDRGYSGHVTVEKQGSRFAADCNLHLASGTDIQAAGQAQDPQSAFEMAAERIGNRSAGTFDRAFSTACSTVWATVCRTVRRRGGGSTSARAMIA